MLSSPVKPNKKTSWNSRNVRAYAGVGLILLLEFVDHTFKSQKK